MTEPRASEVSTSDAVPRVAAVVVNYRTPELTLDCLASLAAERAGWPALEAVVVDNASGDGSADQIADQIAARGWSSWARLIRSAENGGFSAGNNLGIRSIDADLYWLINSDTIVRPGALAALANFLMTHPKVGIAGSRLENLDGSPRNCAFRFPSVLSELEAGLQLGVVSWVLARWTRQPMPQQASSVDWVSGASMMVRRDVFDAIGLLDDRYFLYFEESDFCLRAARANWPCWHIPESRVVHFAGKSTGMPRGSQKLRRRPPYWFNSRHHYFITNLGPFRTALANLAWTSGYTLTLLRRAVTGRLRETTPYLLRDFLYNNFLLWTRRR